MVHACIKLELRADSYVTGIVLTEVKLKTSTDSEKLLTALESHKRDDHAGIKPQSFDKIDWNRLLTLMFSSSLCLKLNQIGKQSLITLESSELNQTPTKCMNFTQLQIDTKNFTFD